MSGLLGSVILVALLARPAAAQSRDTTPRTAGTMVSGVVRDSIAREPLAGAMVQLVAADSLARFGRTAVSDAQGRFAIADVPVGRYTLGFFHPMLDSLGVLPGLLQVFVNGNRPVRADLAIPSPARLRAAICGPRPAADSGAVIVGTVRDARDRTPAAGVTVTGEWLELTFTSGGVFRRTPRIVVKTAETGWFAMCDAPRAGGMMIIASRDADSTDLIEVNVPAEGFLRREMYLGRSRTVVTGTVVTAAEGRPLAGAQVRITESSQTRTNERGEWTLGDAPVGTRMLEVLAVGYYPERRAVDVVTGAASIRVALSTMKAVLDTVHVTAARLYDRDRSAFEARRRSGMGRYLTAADIARRHPIVTSDLFRMVPGLRLEGGVPPRVRMRGPFGDCSPAFYLDGAYLSTLLSADDIDVWVNPSEIVGIEVYTSGTVPAQYQTGLTGCGSIVVWTSPAVPLGGDRIRSRRTFAKAVVFVAATALLLVTVLR